jgi:uncharacterized phage infection (PIP) family protein YhgE
MRAVATARSLVMQKEGGTMARADSKADARRLPFGISGLQDQLERIQEGTVNLASRLRDDATGAFSNGQRMVGDLIDQATQLTDDLQHWVQSTGRDAEQGIERVLVGLEAQLSRRTDGLIQRLTQTLRREQDRVRERLRAMETRVTDLAEQNSGEILDDLRAGVNWTRSSIEQLMAKARRSGDAIEEIQHRLEQTERRLGEIAKESAREVIDGDEFRHKLNRLEQWVSDIARDVGSKHGEQSALRERLVRLETRFVNATKEEAARAASGATVKERQARVEARVGDLTKELLARSIDLSNFKERLAHVEAQLLEYARSGESHIEESHPVAASGG